MNAIERVRKSRTLTNATFSLPDPEDCLWYAITEIAEMIDAQMRLRQPEHLRNHARNDDPRREAGQCGYMLISAWIQICQSDIGDFGPCPRGFTAKRELISILESTLYVLDESMRPESLWFALAAWSRLCVLSGWNADALIDETCADFERKHCVVREVL